MTELRGTLFTKPSVYLQRFLIAIMEAFNIWVEMPFLTLDITLRDQIVFNASRPFTLHAFWLFDVTWKKIMAWHFCVTFWKFSILMHPPTQCFHLNGIKPIFAVKWLHLQTTTRYRMSVEKRYHIYMYIYTVEISSRPVGPCLIN